MQTLTDSELESHIADCALLMGLAMAQHDRAAAEHFRRDMYEAINSRSPAQVAKMEAKRGLSAGCYFLEAGEADALALMQRNAA